MTLLKLGNIVKSLYGEPKYIRVLNAMLKEDSKVGRWTLPGFNTIKLYNQEIKKE